MPGFNIQHTAAGCPGGDSDDSTPAATIETSRRHRFKFEAFDPLSDILIYAHKAGRPRVEIDKMVHHLGQDEIYYPGKQRWLPIDITFYSAHSDSGNDIVAKAIYEWWSEKVLNIAESHITTEEPKKDCTLSLLDGGEFGTIWQYSMYGCWPEKVTPDDLDYADTGLAEISFTLSMDKAEEFRSS